MDWITGMQRAIDYIEAHLTDEIDYEAVAAQSHAIINRVRREVIAADESYEQATARLTRANEEIAAMAKKETDTCLSKVLFSTSLGMKNAFARNDR